ncbi:alpha-N-arabinofuranosidase [Rhodonellum psychrophilum GCM71 = DSM 17998]|uniref:Alpha-N-arabinofuranosidase n=2 Tax=Rhodonellum TaxID=336827 RepID=U5BLX0_9BACT|nr:alpha-N-arabinofuranosidase [Rhodonellum psychrophilum GCM71 = DSM 17998]SDZ29562.1 Glycosyl hydrolases family 43 [Rhodonellum ikkaensis]
MNLKFLGNTALLVMASTYMISCNSPQKTEVETVEEKVNPYLNSPLISHMYTADPSAHVFEGKIYIYPSHDVESDVKEDDSGAHFNMRDFHVFSMDSPGATPLDHGRALDVDDVPWAKRQMWAPDAAEKDGKYYFYFPAKDKDDIFRLGVAVGDRPEGPFKAQPEPMKGSFSIDPAVFQDGNEYYIYWGGIWGGQLQKWRTGKYLSTGNLPYDDEPADDEPAISPVVAKLSADMLEFGEKPREIKILDQDGSPILAGDHERRFFEAAWVHKYNDKYYFSYSTGDTHNIAYATGDSPYGPFTYQGVILKPVQGWTNHHSIVQFEGKWYIFYHDTELTDKTHLRNIKMTELTHNPDGTIQTISPLTGK